MEDILFILLFWSLLSITYFFLFKGKVMVNGKIQSSIVASALVAGEQTSVFIIVAMIACKIMTFIR